jgi:hypothetical protein
MAQYANARRGLKIPGTAFEYLTEGAYGLVFVDRSARRIRKVYRTRELKDPQHLTNVFNSEVMAFKIAMKCSELTELVPEFYGICPTKDVQDHSGNSIASELRGDLSFEMEFLPGSFVKIGTIPTSESDRIQTLFFQCGIRHMSDASVLLDEERITKVIDFAVQESESWD